MKWKQKLVIAKKSKYHLLVVDSYHSLCLDKKEIILVQIQGCERLLKYVTDENDMSILGKEVAELRLALDLMH